MNKQIRPVSELPISNKLARMLWGVAWILLFRITPRPFHAWRCLVLGVFGARIGRGVRVYQSVKIWAPWNLTMGNRSCLGDYVDCYNVGEVCLEEGAIVSQYSYLCTASHDYDHHSNSLTFAPIRICKNAWIAADVFVGPGVTVGAGAVIAARSTVIKDVPEWTVVAGMPLRVIGQRNLQDD